MDLAKAISSMRMVPLVAAESSAQAIEDATTFRDAGFPYVEILCRTPKAIGVIGDACRALPDLFIGAGTVLTVELEEAAIKAGAKFIVSPAFDPAIMEIAQKHNLQYMPGIYTPSDVAVAMRHGYVMQKLFPAGPAGGVDYINALASPYGHTQLQLVAGCGVTKDNVASYLKHPLVAAVIPDWISPLRGQALRDEMPATLKLLKSITK